MRTPPPADPAAALEALREVWPTESAATRADFLGLLADGLSPADEEFLEAALDDRSKEVRRGAARLLARIPGSQYGDRMAERMWSHLTVSQGVLAVDLPKRLSASMERDGIDSQNPEGIGKRAWWFLQIVANTPLSEMDPAWLEMPVEGCAPEILQAAWAEAAVRENAQPLGTRVARRRMLDRQPEPRRAAADPARRRMGPGGRRAAHNHRCRPSWSAGCRCRGRPRWRA